MGDVMMTAVDQSSIMDTLPMLVCLTPVKNEEWILHRFLKGATSWADRIIVADQFSDDASREIAKRFDHVTLVDNDCPTYDEGARQELLLSTARALANGRRQILLALDADEMLSANWRTSDEWERMKSAEPGTVLAFHWVNLLPGCESGWRSDAPIPFGFVDDGSTHSGNVIHSSRLPIPEKAKWLVFEDICVLHYQYTNWARMKSKQRWYQCWERINHPSKRPITIFRQYHHMDADKKRARPVEKKWFDQINSTTNASTEAASPSWFSWDDEVVEFINEWGVRRFRKLDIWDITMLNCGENGGELVGSVLTDPRNRLEKLVHSWLRHTQIYERHFGVRIIQRVLRLIGW